MKRKFYPAIKFGARWGLMVGMVAAYLLLLFHFTGQDSVSLALLTALCRGTAVPCLYLGVAAGSFTISFGLLEWELARRGRLSAAKTQPQLLTDVGTRGGST
jgi:hypothetical protein